METIKVKFAFKIGDYVIFKGTSGRKRGDSFLSLMKKKKKLKAEEFKDAPAQVFRVTDRLYEECYGGSQNHYNLRSLSIGEDGFSYAPVTGVSYSKSEHGLFKAREIELDSVNIKD